MYWNTLKVQDEAIEDGVYDVPVALMSASNPDKASMAGAAIAPTARVTVKGGKVQYKLNFHSMDINMAGSTEKGHLEKFWVYEGDDKSSRAEAMPGDYYTEEGVSYPGSFSFERAKAGEKNIYARVSVDAMAGFDQDVLVTFDGYEVYQATKAKGKYKKIKTISKAKTTKLTVKKLKAKKTYYFKVRAYKKNGKQKLFGTYSKVLRVKM